MSKIEKTMSTSCVVIFIILCIILTILGSIFLAWFINWPHDDIDYCVNSEIYINKDEDFKLNGFLGNGSTDDPYRLENITFQFENLYGVCIKNTEAHFVIRNCTFLEGYNFLNLENIKYNTATIENNTFIYTMSTQYCINLYKSPKTIISKNILRPKYNTSHSQYAIAGIDISSSDYCVIKENKFCNFEIALNVFHSNNLHIEDNVFSLNLFGIWYYYTQQCYLVNNQFFNNSNSIVLTECNGNQIINNYILNSYNSINLEDSSFCSIFDCVISNNNKGIYLDNCNNNQIRNNLLQFSLYYGIKLSSSINNSIYSNNLIDNQLNGSSYGLSQAFDDQNAADLSIRNYWYDSLLYKGNFWSDLVWNEGVIYEIDGGNNTDPYPLEHPVEF